MRQDRTRYEVIRALRYAAGWDLDGRGGVALFLDDRVIDRRESYLDSTWVKQQQGSHRPKDGTLPGAEAHPHQGDRTFVSGIPD